MKSNAVDNRWCPIFSTVLSAFLIFVPAFTPILAQKDKPPVKKDQPRVTMVIPLGVTPGKTAKITIRGLKLDQASSIRFANTKITAKILSKGAASVPNKDPGKDGNTQVVAEVTVPKNEPTQLAGFTVVTPAGESSIHRLLVEATYPLVEEKEPNDGFKQAQKINVPLIVDGAIRQPRDVDVYRFEGKVGQKIVCEILAARHGSMLDSILTLYDAHGLEIASNDDLKDTTDSRIEFTVPRNGNYYLSVIDAHDQGSETHIYRLVVKPAK